MVPQCRQREYMSFVDLSLRKRKGQGCWLQPTKDCLTYFNDVSSLKAVELKKLCRSHGIDETYPKKAKFSYVMFWDWQPLVMQSQNLKF